MAADLPTADATGAGAVVRAVADAGLTAAVARRTGAKIFFADEAHFQADADHVSGYGAGSAGQVGAERGTGPNGLHQPTPGREGTSPRT